MKIETFNYHKLEINNQEAAIIRRVFNEAFDDLDFDPEILRVIQDVVVTLDKAMQ